MTVSSQLPEAPHTPSVQAFESSQPASVVLQSEQVPGTVPQTPAVQVSAVQRSPSSQSAGVLQAVQLSDRSCVHTPSEQASVVQGSSSAGQSLANVQGRQAGSATCEQPAAPPQL